jgi:L,D-peptidoglycan transpeptidase YkuD (ErfK/YbiS/YcfS/YnhG family)
MHFIAYSDGLLDLDGRRVECALGRSGVKTALEKQEGDGATPLGIWPMRRVLYRPDRGEAPVSGLPVAPLTPTDGWCDDPADPNYNRPVVLPYRASCEEMWREDELYDVVVILGHNSDPPVPGKGSAIFLHCAKADYSPTEGCVALAKADLLALLRLAALGSVLEVRQV